MSMLTCSIARSAPAERISWTNRRPGAGISTTNVGERRNDNAPLVNDPSASRVRTLIHRHRSSFIMNATAQLVFDRAYYELHYDDWLSHRSRWRKYAVPAACLLLLFGVGLAFTYRQQWLVGGVFAMFGAYELLAALTHRRRWINARVKTIHPNKTSIVELNEHGVTITSVNGSSRLRTTAFEQIIAAKNGVFLVIDTGVSIYIPEITLDPPDAYRPLITSWIAATKKAEAREKGVTSAQPGLSETMPK